MIWIFPRLFCQKNIELSWIVTKPYFSTGGTWCWLNLLGIFRMISTRNSLQWRHNKLGGVSNPRRLECLLNRLFRRRSVTSKIRIAGLCAGNLPVTGEFPARRTSNAEKVSIWWSHHVLSKIKSLFYPLQYIYRQNPNLVITEPSTISYKLRYPDDAILNDRRDFTKCCTLQVLNLKQVSICSKCNFIL